jgi:lactoylglutathione lyase
MSYLDHIGVYIKDLEKSISFYKEVFNWEETTRFNMGETRIAVLDMGKGLLEIIQRPGSSDILPDSNSGHLAIHVDDFPDKVKKLEGMGLEVRKVTMADGSHIAFFKDPDNHVIEITEKGLSITD